MIYLKKSLSKWINIDEEGKIKFLLDYPSIEKGEELNALAIEYRNKTMESTSEYYDDMKANGSVEGYIPKSHLIKYDISAEADILFLKYKRLFIRYHIKDWQGLDDKCVLKDGILDEELWWGLVRNTDQTESLYQLIYNECGYDETDKKKLDSVNGSEITDTQKESETTIH